MAWLHLDAYEQDVAEKKLLVLVGRIAGGENCLESGIFKYWNIVTRCKLEEIDAYRINRKKHIEQVKESVLCPFGGVSLEYSTLCSDGIEAKGAAERTFVELEKFSLK